MSEIQLIKTQQTERLEILIKMFKSRDRNRVIHFEQMNWSVFDGVFYTYLNLKGFQITFEPCAKGFDVGLYKLGNDGVGLNIRKLCTNCKQEQMTVSNVVDRAIESAEYLVNKYIEKVE